jgi:hypothetical protein
MPVLPGGMIIESLVNVYLHLYKMQSAMDASNSDVVVIFTLRFGGFRHNTMNLKGISRHSLIISRKFIDT